MTRPDEVKTRVSALLNVLVTTSGGAGTVKFRDLSDSLAEITHTETADTSLRNWISGKCIPQNTKAVALGEALYKSRVPWMSGMLMLWLCGHHADYIAVAAYVIRDLRKKHLLRLKRRTRNQFELHNVAMMRFVTLFQAMTIHAQKLIAPNALDAASPPLKRCFIRKKYMDNQTLNLLRPFDPPALSKDELLDLTDYMQADPDSVTYWMREHAKTSWIAFRKYKPSFQELFDRWQPPKSGLERKPRRAGYIAENHLDRIVVAMLEIASSPNMSLGAMETTLLVMMGHWLTYINFDDQPDIAGITMGVPLIY